MKKLFVSILALAAFAACQSDFNDVNLEAPQGGNANVGGSHTLYAEVGVVGEEDTKATYGEGLVATWEENDQIALLQEHANYGTTFSAVNKLNIKDGAGTSKALFNGEIQVDSESPRVYHIAYPASAVKFSTTVSQEVVEESMTFDGAVSGGTGSYAATGYAKCTYESTLTVTVPTTQNGKWEPYMYASTSEAVNSEAIGAKVLTTLTGAIAVRAFEPDGVTTKQLKQITITSSSAALAGAFTGTATSAGNTTTITGAKSSWGSDLFEGENMRTEASNNLKSDLQGYEATSTTVTKALSLSFVGGEKSITISGLESIPADSDGFYTYYINVAPATLAAGTLTIEAVDTNNTATKKTLKDEITIAASQFKGAKVVWESATLNCDETTIETWYDNYGKGSAFELAGSTIYIDNVSIEGNILAENVKALGVELNGVFHEASAQSGVLENDLAIEISGLASGYYEVQPCAKVVMNGKEETIYGPKVRKTVTAIPTVTEYYVQSSYSYNGNVQKDNNIAGDLLKVKANISDSFIASEGLVSGAKYEVYNGGTKLGEKTLGEEWTTNVGYRALGQYDCYVKISLGNGYSFTSQAYTTHVVGIPYSIQFYGSNIDNIKGAGWTLNGSTEMNSDFLCLYRTSSKSKKINGYAVSPKLPVTENTDVNFTIKHKSYWVGFGSTAIKGYIGATSSKTQAASSYVTCTPESTGELGTGALRTQSGSISLNSSNCYISISHDEPTTNLAEYRYLVYSLEVNYK
ncbi:MAG: hypothetical protein E7129_07465 [Rikenellaceae bacterium]|nr:hypothetical protein [Rikenellaceae bacterium]